MFFQIIISENTVFHWMSAATNLRIDVSVRFATYYLFCATLAFPRIVYCGQFLAFKIEKKNITVNMKRESNEITGLVEVESKSIKFASK